MGFLDKLLGRKQAEPEPNAMEAAISTPPASETDTGAVSEHSHEGHDHDHDHGEHDHSH